MTTQTAQNPSFPRFRGGFGLSSRSREAKIKSGGDEDWVIPYNGPYEAPREPARRLKARDSWGDPLEEYDDDSMLAARELYLRYGGHNDFNTNTQSGGGGPSKLVEEERKGRTRDRSFSVMSGRTTSSGAVDPTRGSLGTNRRSTVSSSLRPPVPSYINFDAVGGVGESPVPHVRNSKDANRISLASIFSLGGLVRKTASSPALSVDRTSSGRKAGRSSRPNTSEKAIRRSGSPKPRRSTSNDSRRPFGGFSNDSKLRQTDKTSLTGTDEDDYYNSYYSTLITKEGDHSHPYQPYNQPRSPNSSFGSHNSNPLQQQREHARQNSSSTTSGHPYAYVFPQIRIPEPPRTAPPAPTPQMASAQIPGPGPSNPPRLMFTTASGHHQLQPQQQQGPNSADAAHSAFSPRSAGVRSLRSPASTPDLRIRVPGQNMVTTTANASVSKNLPGFSFPKGKDRWLSAETWCDALLFPRPRLKLKQDPVEGPISESSGRIVSPPSTPLGQDDFGFGVQQSQQSREQGIASRVLAHSRSLVDLHKGKKKAEDIQHPFAVSSTSKDPQTSRSGAQTQTQTTRPPRPKSFAQDDLALPTPTPSLAHVLREGELLESQRRAWQMQATSSWGNKRARSMSRTRAKSLTKQGRQQQGNHQHQSSVEYIAARACLGTQPMTPIIVPDKQNTSYFSDAHMNTMSTTRSRGTHSHNNSLTTKTTTKSSNKTHSRNHSRNDSWGKSAMKMAKSTVICGYPSGDDESIVGERSSHKVGDLEGALKRNETKVIRLADPAYIPVDRGLAVHQHQHQHQPQLSRPVQPRHTPSPADSRLSDSKVGIALGTPPEEESDYIPNHPYAQGGLSFSSVPAPPSSSEHHPRPADYAGPHPSINTGLKAPQIPEIIARHKLPPHMLLHPYAQQQASTSRDSYLDVNGLIGQFRSDDATPNPSKMWAQLSPGVVREILPDDLKYSPFLPESGRASPTQDRQSIVINDIVGLAETLVNATRYGGVGGGSQDHGTASASAGSHRATPPQQPSEHEHSGWEGEQAQHELDLPEFGYRPRRNGFQLDLSSSRPKLEDMHKPSDPSTGHTHASSQLEYLPTPPTERDQSPAATLESSPPESPRPLGSPHDLEGFQDLFYRPNPNVTGRTPNEAALPETPSPPNRSSTPWDLMPNRRTGNSSLTSLARQLTDEFEAMALDRLGERLGERTSSQLSQSPTSSFRRGTARRPTDGSSLQFVFEEASSGGGSAREDGSNVSGVLDEPIHAFEPSETLPEDIQSSRASSFIEGAVEDDDPTAVFRVGKVESVSTPPTISSSHHLSAEQSAFVHNRQGQEQDRSSGLESSQSQDLEQDRIVSGVSGVSGLQPPTEATRSSYMTSSTASRMSGLSEFPTPPKDDSYVSAKHHMSMLSSYFDEAHTQSEVQSQGQVQAQGRSTFHPYQQLQSHLPPIPPTPQEEMDELQHSVMFGVNQNAATVAEGLSSQSPPLPPTIPAPPF